MGRVNVFIRLGFPLSLLMLPAPFACADDCDATKANPYAAIDESLCRSTIDLAKAGYSDKLGDNPPSDSVTYLDKPGQVLTYLSQSKDKNSPNKDTPLFNFKKTLADKIAASKEGPVVLGANGPEKSPLIKTEFADNSQYCQTNSYSGSKDSESMSFTAPDGKAIKVKLTSPETLANDANRTSSDGLFDWTHGPHNDSFKIPDTITLGGREINCSTVAKQNCQVQELQKRYKNSAAGAAAVATNTLEKAIPGIIKQTDTLKDAVTDITDKQSKSRDSIAAARANVNRLENDAAVLEGAVPKVPEDPSKANQVKVQLQEIVTAKADAPKVEAALRQQIGTQGITGDEGTAGTTVSDNNAKIAVQTQTLKTNNETAEATITDLQAKRALLDNPILSDDKKIQTLKDKYDTAIGNLQDALAASKKIATGSADFAQKQESAVVSLRSEAIIVGKKLSSPDSALAKNAVLAETELKEIDNAAKVAADKNRSALAEGRDATKDGVGTNSGDPDVSKSSSVQQPPAKPPNPLVSKFEVLASAQFKTMENTPDFAQASGSGNLAKVLGLPSDKYNVLYEKTDGDSNDPSGGGPKETGRAWTFVYRVTDTSTHTTSMVKVVTGSTEYFGGKIKVLSVTPYQSQ